MIEILIEIKKTDRTHKQKHKWRVRVLCPEADVTLQWKCRSHTVHSVMQYIHRPFSASLLHSQIHIETRRETTVHQISTDPHDDSVCDMRLSFANRSICLHLAVGLFVEQPRMETMRLFRLPNNQLLKSLSAPSVFPHIHHGCLSDACTPQVTLTPWKNVLFITTLA